MNEQHLGSDFDEFLKEESLLEETEAVAAKRVLDYQIACPSPSSKRKEKDML